MGQGPEFGSLDNALKQHLNNTAGNLLSQQLHAVQQDPLETDEHFSKLRQHRLHRLQSANRYSHGAKRPGKSSGTNMYLGPA